MKATIKYEFMKSVFEDGRSAVGAIDSKTNIFLVLLTGSLGFLMSGEAKIIKEVYKISPPAVTLLGVFFVMACMMFMLIIFEPFQREDIVYETKEQNKKLFFPLSWDSDVNMYSKKVQKLTEKTIIDILCFERLKFQKTYEFKMRWYRFGATFFMLYFLIYVSILYISFYHN